MVLSPEQLNKLNEKRVNGVHYFYKVSSMGLLYIKKNKNLVEYPFILKLENSANRDGYWLGNHIIVQFEDFINCLDCIYGDEYDSFFQFYHSSVNAREKTNGLDASKLNKYHVGPLQHPTTTKERMVTLVHTMLFTTLWWWILLRSKCLTGMLNSNCSQSYYGWQQKILSWKVKMYQL